MLNNPTITELTQVHRWLTLDATKMHYTHTPTHFISLRTCMFNNIVSLRCAADGLEASRPSYKEHTLISTE